MKYEIKGQMTVSCWTEVEADSPEEALKIAKERTDNVATHNIDGTYPVNEFFHFDNDGGPSDLKMEE